MRSAHPVITAPSTPDNPDNPITQMKISQSFQWVIIWFPVIARLSYKSTDNPTDIVEIRESKEIREGPPLYGLKPGFQPSGYRLSVTDNRTDNPKSGIGPLISLRNFDSGYPVIAVIGG